MNTKVTLIKIFQKYFIFTQTTYTNNALKIKYVWTGDPKQFIHRHVHSEILIIHCQFFHAIQFKIAHFLMVTKKYIFLI